MAPKPFSVRKIQQITKQRIKSGDKNPAVILKTPGLFGKYIDVSTEVNQYKSKTDFERVSQIINKKAKSKFGKYVLIQMKGNLRDPFAKHLPNSLPRRSSLLGIIKASKKGITKFPIAVFDPAGELMGYTLIKISPKAQAFINNVFKGDLDRPTSEKAFNSFADKIIPTTGEHPEQRYVSHLKEFLGFEIEQVAMPGYILDPKTMDFREVIPAELNPKERIAFKKAEDRKYRQEAVNEKINKIKGKIVRVAEKIDATSMHPKLKKNR